MDTAKHHDGKLRSRAYTKLKHQVYTIESTHEWAVFNNCINLEFSLQITNDQYMSYDRINPRMGCIQQLYKPRVLITDHE